MMTDKEIRDLIELLLALEEDSPMPDKRKIYQLKIILKRLNETQKEKEVRNNENSGRN